MARYYAWGAVVAVVLLIVGMVVFTTGGWGPDDKYAQCRATKAAGGVGTIGRTVLGVIFLAIVANALVQAGVPTYWEKVAYGAMLVLSVMLERYFRYQRTGVEEVWKDFMLGGRV